MRKRGGNATVEQYETEGPQKIRVKFSRISPELVCIMVSGSLGVVREVNFVLDNNEFKHFLKAGLRLDETISNAR
jgi:hypothetical protein